MITTGSFPKALVGGAPKPKKQPIVPKLATLYSKKVRKQKSY